MVIRGLGQIGKNITERSSRLNVGVEAEFVCKFLCKTLTPRFKETAPWCTETKRP